MRIKRTKKSDRKSGFTLLELLLVMAILVVLASLSTFAILNLQRKSLQKSAFMEIQTLKKACKMYKLDVGSFPTQLNDLFTLPSGLNNSTWGGPYLDTPIQADPWQQEYIYGANEQSDVVTISSNGPDRQKGTADDVPDPNVANANG